MYRVEMPQAVRDLVRHLPPQLKAKVKTGLQTIASDPHCAKALRDDLAGLRSYRIGRNRIVFRIVGAAIQIIALGPRIYIYERAAAELSKTLRNGEKK